MKTIITAFFLVTTICSAAQRKPLDHTVYDGWQSIGERLISNDGNWVIYSVNVQEGDNELVIQSASTLLRTIVPRGYNAVITDDSRFVVFSIKPFYAATREARIKKKRPDEMPKDTLAIHELGKTDIWKKPLVKNYKVPGEVQNWVAYHLEKVIPPPAKGKTVVPENKKIADSLVRVIDSLYAVIDNMPKKKKSKKNKDEDFEEYDEYGFAVVDDANDEEAGSKGTSEGTDLLLRNLATGEEITFPLVLQYQFSKKGNKLLLELSKDPKDSLSKPAIILYDIAQKKKNPVLTGGNSFKNFVLSEDGTQLAFVAERDAKPKDLQKFYKLWYYKEGMDSATMLADKTTVGLRLGMDISEYGNLSFSKNGKRLFFGVAPIAPAKDTTLVEMDLVKLDIWHYKEDYLQTVQLSRLKRDSEQSYLAVYHLENNKFEQLADEEIPAVWQTDEGNGDYVIGVTDVGRRVESQWTGNTVKDIYTIHVEDGSKKLIKKDVNGMISPASVSPSGKYILWYDFKEKNYFAYSEGDPIRNITVKIKTALYNEDHDSPSEPYPYGIMRWNEKEDAVFIYDRYGVWQVDPLGKKAPFLLLSGRDNKVEYRYVATDPEERFIKDGQRLLFRRFDEKNKNAGFGECIVQEGTYTYKAINPDSAYSIGQIKKAKTKGAYIYTKETYVKSPDLYVKNYEDVYDKMPNERQLSFINPQQRDYIWGTAELYKWKTFSGKPSEGILYKPDNFNASNKYPVILYFYEKLSDGLHGYIAPAPTPSRLNISFFVSRGYIVFAPDISYTIGHPAKSAYDYIVSAAKDLTKHSWVDAKNIGVQGQSWGGIQVAQIIAMTDMFKAAWAGAPVSNMTSAYGGIRWESGMNRQFQYEKTQSRIGATLWEKPELYIESSPLFHLPKVKTPLVIMANDNDGAVPWYQGIELFTGLRRLGKPTWMLNYNGEAHNLMHRKNRKDIQIREQQFFDWLLKGEKPAKWITEGVPAVKKGKEWGLELVD